MWKLCCYASSNVNMVAPSSSLLSRSLLLVGVSLLLLGSEVHCVVVGLGKHTMTSNSIVKMGSVSQMASKDADLTAMKNLPGACNDVFIDDNGM